MGMLRILDCRFSHLVSLMVGRHVEKKPGVAASLFTELAKAGHPLAQVFLPVYLFMILFCLLHSAAL